MKDFIARVIETVGIPGRMFAPGTFVKKLGTGTIVQSEPFDYVFNGVGMNQIHHDCHAHPMGLIDQVLQLLGGSKPGGGGKEAGDMVSETPVVRMFGDGHQLNGVVPRSLDSGQNFVTKLVVGVDAGFFARHSNMGFIDKRCLTGGPEGMYEMEGIPGLPHLRIKNIGR